MSRFSALLSGAALVLLLQVTCTLGLNRIRELVELSPFPASIKDEDIITVPNNASLPPILRSLRLSLSEKTAISPIVDSPGEVTRKKRALIIAFASPRVNLKLKMIRERPRNDTRVLFRGKVRFRFTRPFAVRVHPAHKTVPEAVAALKKFLEENPGPRLVTVVDHAAAASSVGLNLPPSSVVVFGNPAIGSQIWRRQPAAGIELPLEILIAESPLGQVYVAWNTASLLRKRFGLARSEPDMAGLFKTIDSVLARLAGVAAGREFKPADKRFDNDRIGRALDGINIQKQNGNAVDAFNRLIDALIAVPPVGIAYQIPHEIAALNAGLPTDGLIVRVVVFGNPALGTRIMQRSFTAALDLPVKMAVWTTASGAKGFQVGYTTAEWIGLRHNVEVPEMLSGALNSFAEVAVGV